MFSYFETPLLAEFHRMEQGFDDPSGAPSGARDHPDVGPASYSAQGRETKIIIFFATSPRSHHYSTCIPPKPLGLI